MRRFGLLARDGTRMVTAVRGRNTRRRVLTVVVAAGIAMLPTIGAGAATPTLGGEVLTAGNPPTPGTTFSSSQVCLPGTISPSDTFTFTADGTATGPIPGRFTESGGGTLSSGSANSF